MRNSIGRWALVGAIALFAASAGFYAGASGLLPWVNERIAPFGSSVWKVYKAEQLIEKHFVNPMDEEKLVDAAIEGMLQSLDDAYAGYYTPEEFAERMSRLHAELVGIGVVVEKTADGAFVIQSVYPGTPAETAGIRPQDRIQAVDDKPVDGLALEELTDMVRGPKGTSVKLKLERKGEPQPLELTIKRAVIQLPNTEHKMLDEAAGVGYVRLYGFTGNAAVNVKKAIDDLTAKGMKRLIVDLRYNGGGLLEEAIGVSSLFVPKGKPITHLQYRDRPKRTLWSQATTDKPFDKSLVVLVNESTASASEVFSGAIKDLKLGKLVGTKTFGKGVSQTWYEMRDGSGLQITTANYLTAGEISIHGTGIQPDIVVQNDSPNVLPGEPGDKQLEAAIQAVKEMPLPEQPTG